MFDYWEHIKQGATVKFKRAPLTYNEKNELTYAVHISVEYEDGTICHKVYTKDHVNQKIAQLEEELNKYKQFKKEATEFINRHEDTLILSS